MTDLIIRTLARRRLANLARPTAVLAFAIAIAYGGGLWLTLLHHVEGGHERNEPPFVLHWLRDATLALPLICVAVWVGIVLARRLLHRAGAADGPLALCGAVLATVVALCATVSVTYASLAHGSLFGAEHGGQELPFLLHLGRDALIALAANLVMAALAAAGLLRRRPWAAPQVETWLRRRSGRNRFALQGALALVLLVPLVILGAGTAELVVAQSGPGTPCPTGTPLKTYSVQAIDVDIPLNRFGDRDPSGKMYVLSDEVDAVRAQEASRHVSIGLRDDAIQPLVIRANVGDCVEIEFTNNASGGDYGVHIDGLAFDTNGSGDAVGENTSSAVSRGERRTYRFFVPDEKELEGNHYIRPGPGLRNAVSHGLFGALVVEPEGSTYHSMDTLQPISSGWEAVIKPGNGKKAFREYVKLHHEIGDELFDIIDSTGGKLPRVDPHTEAYRPGSRAINYRTEPFMNRFDGPTSSAKEEAHGYSSYVFGDPATPIPRSYVGDPTKIRILHTGTEVFHVYHLHGGGIRWRLNPHADPTWDYQDTGLRKHPVEDSKSSRLDSQAFGPGESYDLEIEGGAGGAQQGAGEFLFHCHIVEHYVAGMWGFWRVYDTRQPHLATMPDRAAPPQAVDSAGLIGRTMPDGTTLTKDNLDGWIRPQLPPQGVPGDVKDATVWDWRVNADDGTRPVYLGETEDTQTWANYTSAQDAERLAGHPTLYPGDEVVGNRPKIKFNPSNGRPAFPLLRPHLGKRPPFSPNGHSGAPYLGERGNAAKTKAGPDPAAGRADAICPSGAPMRKFNIVTIPTNTPVTDTASDANGKIFSLAKDVPAYEAGRGAEPLAIRANIGDCVNVTLTNKIPDTGAFNGYSKNNLHIHHVQFDTQASDGVITGLSYEQAIRPYQVEDPRLTAAATIGSTTLELSDVRKFQGTAPGGLRGIDVAIGIGLGTEKIEINAVSAVAPGTPAADGSVPGTITLRDPLTNDHSSGHTAGTEFVQSRWYPDVALDNIFWHDHVDGIHGWSAGLVGQLIIEPRGSTYHDPKTGAEIESGAIADIRTPNALAKGLVDSSFRELALWTIDGNTVTDSTLNLRSEPLSARLAADPDPSLLFSSWRHGDPRTPLLQAYRGDPVAIRTINVSPTLDTLKVDGHRFFTENRYRGADGKVASTPTDALHYGVSERYTAILDGGAKRAGDYLYFNGIGRRLNQGAWGLMRVLPRKISDLQPLPGSMVHDGGTPLPAPTGGRPPEALTAGAPCPDDATVRQVEIAAVDLPNATPGVSAAYVPLSQAEQVLSGAIRPQPLTIHVAAGECLEVALHNLRASRASFNVGELQKAIESSGVNVGFNPEQTVAANSANSAAGPAATPAQLLAAAAKRTYRFHADTRKIGAAVIGDFGAFDSGSTGMYGAVVVAPAGATFSDPVSGEPTRFGTQVDVHVAGASSYRDFTAIMADDDPILGGDFMPYPTEVAGPSVINYRSAPRADDAAAFSTAANGDPATPTMRAYAGDPVKVHAIVAPGSEQGHVFGLGGQTWKLDAEIDGSNQVASQGMGAWQAFDMSIVGGAGARNRATGDFFYGDVRRAFTNAGMWGLFRVLSDTRCPIKPLPGLDCKGQPSLLTGKPQTPAPDPFPPSPQPIPPATTVTPRAPAPAAIRLGKLRVPARINLRVLAKSGLPVRVRVPANTRALQFRFIRVALSGRRTTAVTLHRTIRRGGSLKMTLKLTKAQLRKLKAGRYVLEVRAGPTRKRLAKRAVTADLRLSGRLPRATGRR